MGLAAYVRTLSRSTIEDHHSSNGMSLRHGLHVAFVAFDDAPGVWRISHAVRCLN